jgi:FkbM family methyltransferase
MKRVQGYWWPDDVGEKWAHSLRHVKSIEWAIKRARRRRTAVQAGGNVGLWPRALAKKFERVITFEPDAVSRECLRHNVADLRNVTVMETALGDHVGVCDIEHRSLGSHRVVEGAGVNVITLDGLDLRDVDLLQLDVEGYELHALRGARDTIARCRPIVQVELRNFGERYDGDDAAVRAFLKTFGYEEVSQQPGNDFVFEVAS